MPVLSGPQLERLSNLVDQAFDLNGLAQLVRFKLNERLENIASSNEPNPAIILALLEWADQRGPGMVETLLRGIVEARPGVPELQQFCKDFFPKVLLPFDGEAAAGTVARGLEELAKLRDDPVVRQTMGLFRANFQNGSGQIRILQSYKKLHESLHQLQLQLTAIGEAVSRAPTDAGARAILSIYALNLGQLASRARTSAKDVPSQPIELRWIEDFDGCVEVLSKAATSDVDVLERVPDRLRDLLTEAPRINYGLAILANVLRLDALSTAMGTIIKGLQVDPNSPALAPLTDGMQALSVLAPRLAGLVAQHFEWQWIEKELVTAELQPNLAPAKKIIRWKEFKPKLLVLCFLDGSGAWAQDLQKRLPQWDAPGGNAAGGSDFDLVRHVCLLRFYEVDGELDTLCGQLLMIAGPLDTLLAVIGS